VTSGLVRPLEVEDLERTLRRQAEQIRAALARIAGELELPWSFQVARGHLLEQVFAAASGTDLVVVGRTQRPASRSVGAPQPAPAPGVSVLFDATEAGDRALFAALELAQGHPEQLALLVPAGTASQLAALQRRAASVLGIPPDLARLQPIAAPQVGELSQQTRRRRSRALVLSIHCLPDLRAQIRVLLEVADCPVVLVR
jgi:hypothetical protein